MTDFEEYYEEYLTLHQNKWNRYLHFLGTVVAFTVAGVGLFTLNWILILVAPLLVYPFAWTGHLLVEGNKPAAWSNPIMARRADLRMFWETLTGKLE